MARSGVAPFLLTSQRGRGNGPAGSAHAGAVARDGAWDRPWDCPWDWTPGTMPATVDCAGSGAGRGASGSFSGGSSDSITKRRVVLWPQPTRR